MVKISAFFILLCISILINPIFAEEPELSTDEIVLSEDLDEGVITGKVVSMDTVAGTISVKTDRDKGKTFSVIDGETILWKGIEDIELSDVSEGQEAEVGYYTDDSGTLIASWVDVLIEEEEVAIPQASQEE